MHYAPPKPRGPSGFASFLPIADRAFPFPSLDGRAFVRLPAATFGAYICHPVRSRAFRDWFFIQSFAEYSTVPTPHAFGAICRHLEAQALNQPGMRNIPVSRRVASAGDLAHPKIRIDLANPEGQFVEVSPEGWHLDNGEGSPFETSPSTGSLDAPEPPAPDGPATAAPLQFLRSSLNLGPHNSPGWLRCLAWLLAALRPTGPYPILILRGPSGSGKSFAARILRLLVDPGMCPFTPTPSSTRQLLALARDTWLLAFDHISSLSPQIADALCRLTSGVGIAVREDARREPLQQWVKRPILLTVTESWTPPPDLAARAFIVDLPALTPDARRTEEHLLASLETALPQILGTLYTALSAALRGVRGAGSRPAPPFQSRHADALVWALGAVSVLGCTPEEMRQAIDAPPAPAPIVDAVRTLLEDRTHWTGPAADLLTLLPFSQTPKGISHKLRNHALDLADAGIEVQFRRLPGGARRIALDASQNSAPPPQPPDKKELAPIPEIPAPAAKCVTSATEPLPSAQPPARSAQPRPPTPARSANPQPPTPARSAPPRPSIQLMSNLD